MNVLVAQEAGHTPEDHEPQPQVGYANQEPRDGGVVEPFSPRAATRGPPAGEGMAGSRWGGGGGRASQAGKSRCKGAEVG